MGKPALHPALTRGDASRAIRTFGVSPRTVGIPLLEVDATDDAWLAARRGYLGASETAAVMGMSPHASPFSVWWQKHAGTTTDQTMAMHIGHKLEPVIGELFAEEMPGHLVFRPGARLWGHHAETWMAATPDYFVVSPETPRAVIPLECKSDEGGAWGRPMTADIPAHHKVQLVQQMAVCGSHIGYLMRLAGKRPTLYRVLWDDDVAALYASMVAHGRTFMAAVEAGVAPDIDGHDATAHALVEMNPAVDADTETEIPDALVAAYRDAQTAAKLAELEVARLKNEIRSRMGRCQYAVDADGMRVASRRVYKRRGYEVAPAIIDAIHPINPNPYV